MTKNETVCILGTGYYGIALGKRLLSYGYHIVYGSRNPDLNYLNECFENLNNENYSVCSVAEAWLKSTRFVFFAVSAFDSVYESIVNDLFSNLKISKKSLSSRIVIEISNVLDGNQNSKLSNAQKLQNLFQNELEKRSINCQIHVCKGFNLTSAYSLSEQADNLRKEALTSKMAVPIAGDDLTSKQSVIELCNGLGFSAYDFGFLNEASLKLEQTNRQIFDTWFYPTVLSMAFLAFNFVWIFFHYFQFPKKPLTFQQYLNDFSLLSHTNKVLGYTSLQLLAFVYFATAVASVYQLIYSTKYQKFPKYLDWWLKTRKQFGLLAFFLAGLHAIATIYIVNPFYLADWFRTPDQFSNLKILTLNGEIALILGILALAFMIILALTSINSIGNSLTFGEWRFVQSNLGIFSLILGTLHTIVMYSRIYGEKDKFNYNLTYLVTRVKMIAFIFPVFVLFSRLLLGYFPPLAQRIEKIRYGMINSKAKASSKHD